VNRKGTRRLVEIRVGRRGRLSRFDSTFLGGQLHREQDGNTVSLRDARDQHYRFVPDRLGLRLVDRKNTLEPELAIFDPNRLHWRLYDFFKF